MTLGKWAAGSKIDAQEQHFGEMFCEILFSNSLRDSKNEKYQKGCVPMLRLSSSDTQNAKGNVCLCQKYHVDVTDQ